MSEKERLETRRLFLESVIKKAQAQLEHAPEGTLRISTTGGRVQYFHCENPADRKGKYISRKNYSLAQGLAQKNYALKVLKAAEAEWKALNAFLKRYPALITEDVYADLSDARKQLVRPFIETDEMVIERWNRKEYTGKPFDEASPELYTERGERVRSKSELIIADMLAKHGIPYRYEAPLKLSGIGVVHPDFTVLHVRKRMELYWEHQGMMDDPGYAEDAVRKVSSYVKTGLFPGDRLILTSETRAVPFDSRQAERMIIHYLK